MGGFFILRKNGLPDSASAIQRAADSAERMGFRDPVTFERDGYHFCVYPKIGGSSTVAMERYENGDFAFSCGTLIYGGRTGKAAVDALYRKMGSSMILPEDCYGHFAVVLSRGGRIEILTDSFGGFQIYYDMSQRVISSSFLQLAAALPSVSFSVQNIYEYVFNGVVSGNETLLREIMRMPIGGSLELAGDQFVLHRAHQEPPLEFDDRPVEQHLERVDAALTGYFEAVASIFGDDVVSALSGGYDSRLLLAYLRRLGLRPRLYVYGTKDDPDVELAQHIARSEDLAIDVIDKGNDMGPLADFAQTVERNYWSNDGYVWAGLFNNGAESVERRRRVGGGALGMNGGGGEILRNFFYLIDGSYSPRQILWSFYSRFDPSMCTSVFFAESYYRRLEEKLAELVGDADRLAPPAVSWIYHRFRCRSWDGKVNSDNNRFGHTVLPFQEGRLTEIASRIPTKYKNHGELEAMLIRRVDMRLAEYPSTYGHSFGAPSPLKRKVVDYATMLRPTTLRRFSFRLQQRLGMREDGPEPSASYLEAVLPGELHIAGQLMRLDRLRDAGQTNRILSLEYFARRLGATLDPAMD